jgi:hypothetical protein
VDAGPERGSASTRTYTAIDACLLEPCNNCRLTLPPLRSGVAEVTLSADHELLKPATECLHRWPFECRSLNGDVARVPPAQTAGSLMETTLLFAESARRSAAQIAGAGSTLQPAPMDGRVVISTMRKRSLVIGCPTLFVIRRLKVRVPKVLFLWISRCHVAKTIWRCIFRNR